MPSVKTFRRDSMSPGRGASYQTGSPSITDRSMMFELVYFQDPRSQGLVQLSAEERRTLIQEGYPVPTRLPLSKAEEESLKIVRRKIKNKLSAQESRRKRKEYMDTLESRCQAYFNENSQLKSEWVIKKLKYPFNVSQIFRG
ncbi:bZIP transcription factor [Cooperia oncophora]